VNPSTGGIADEFVAFVRARTPSLLRSAVLLTGDQHLAEDLVQTALARTHQSWRRLYASGNADAYTRRIMYHLQVSWWRRRRVAEVMPETMPPRTSRSQPRASNDTDEIALRVTLREALLRLTKRQRAVLVLRFYEDLSESETAEILGVAVGTVKSQTSKALARLRAVAPELAEFHGAEGVVG
jgi:RNA polymerase sigma-70 factor (sigma-E family)